MYPEEQGRAWFGSFASEVIAYLPLSHPLLPGASRKPVVFVLFLCFSLSDLIANAGSLLAQWAGGGQAMAQSLFSFTSGFADTEAWEGKQRVVLTSCQGLHFVNLSCPSSTPPFPCFSLRNVSLEVEKMLNETADLSRPS